MKIKTAVVLAVLSIISCELQFARAQGTAFSYNGRLSSGGAPANGSYDLTFSLFNAASNGVVAAGPVTNSATAVSNGLFSVTLDFGPGVFTGTNYWLEMGVRTNGPGAFTTLTPRQPILPVPYAIMANSASNLLGILPAGQISGAVANGNLPASPTFSGAVSAGAFVGDGSGLTNLNPYNLVTGGVRAQLYATNPFNQFNGVFVGYHNGDGSGLTNLNPFNLVSGGVQAQLYATNPFNQFNGVFVGYHNGDGSGLTNLIPYNLVSGGVRAQLYATNPFNQFNGVFVGYHNGDGSGLTNLNPFNLASGGVQAQLYATNPFNQFNGVFVGYHNGDGSGLTNLNPFNLVSGGIQAQLYATNPFNQFNGVFVGYHNGDGSGLTNLNANAVANGLTTNIVVTVPTGTATLCFTNGILRAVR